MAAANTEPLLKEEEAIAVAPHCLEETAKPTFAERIEPYVGLGALFISAFFFSIGILCVKILTKRGVSTIHIALARMVGQMTLGATAIYLQGDSVFVSRDVLPYLLIRGLSGSSALTMFYIAVRALDLGDANAIYFTSPFFGTLIAYLWLGEKITIWSLGMAILSFTGFILVARPEFLFPTAGDTALHCALTLNKAVGRFADAAGVAKPDHIFMWSCVALLGAVLAGIALAAIRAINRRATVMQMVFYFGFVGSLYLIPVTVYNYFRHSLTFDWMRNAESVGLLCTVVVASYIAQSLLNVGMSREKVGVGAFLRNLDIVFAYVYQVTLLDRPAHMCSILGSTLIVMSSVLVFVARYFDNPPDKLVVADSPLHLMQKSLSGNLDYNSCNSARPGTLKL